MDVDRRTLLISLTSTAATLALPKHALGALATECFAAARKDDRGNFSAALFSLNGDMRSVELPRRGLLTTAAYHEHQRHDKQPTSGHGRASDDDKATRE